MFLFRGLVSCCFASAFARGDFLRIAERFSACKPETGIFPEKRKRARQPLIYVGITPKSGKHPGNASLAALRICLLAAAVILVPAAAQAGSDSNPADGPYLATAYDETGITASGLYTHRHIVAADPDVLPIGTIIRISHAGRYSGEYVVADTGRKIVGRRLDIYIPSLEACKQFGVRHVKVLVIALGQNTHRSAKAAYFEVKRDVQHELENNVPAGAATAEDWAAANLAASRMAEAGAAK